MSESLRSLLVLGGARSGKSRYAGTLAENSGRRMVLIATAVAGDAEMTERILLHRQDRGPAWLTIEEPMEIAGAMEREAGGDAIVVVDCLTLWLSNLMLDGADADAAVSRLSRLVAALRGPVILVSNEVGQGIVPRTPLGRGFRDAQGRLNQAMAAACDCVVLISAGIPMRIKPAPAPDFHF